MTKKLKKRPHSITFTQPSLTQQHSKDEVDINNIMARYIKTGVIDHVAKYEPQYSVNTDVDYHQSMNIIIKADEMFGDLPSAVRKQFENDPAQFLKFVSNPDNISKLAEMGLTDQPYNPTPVEPPAPDPTTAKPSESKTSSESSATAPATP